RPHTSHSTIFAVTLKVHPCVNVRTVVRAEKRIIVQIVPHDSHLVSRKILEHITQSRIFTGSTNDRSQRTIRHSWQSPSPLVFPSGVDTAQVPRLSSPLGRTHRS